jgi:hypothetical protein
MPSLVAVPVTEAAGWCVSVGMWSLLTLAALPGTNLLLILL